MAAYLDQVKAQSDAQALLKISDKDKPDVSWTERMTPLEDRVSKLLSSMPADVIKEGLSLDALRRLLSGKWRGNCHPGELGKALRKLGFVRIRYWSKSGGGFHAKWHIKTIQNTKSQ
jgi:hypothetical protein